MHKGTPLVGAGGAVESVTTLGSVCQGADGPTAATEAGEPLRKMQNVALGEAGDSALERSGNAIGSHVVGWCKRMIANVSAILSRRLRVRSPGSSGAG